MRNSVFIAKVLTKLVRGRDMLLSRVRSRQFASCGPRALIRSPRIIIGSQYVVIGADFDCFPGLRLEMYDRHLDKRFTPSLVIGDRVSINYDCHIGCVNRIEIGDGVLIASRVYISDHIHGALDYSDIATPPSVRRVNSKGPIVIEDDAWIGEAVCVMPNVRIGKGAIIGANSVVTRDVPPYSIAAGSPCKVIRTLVAP